MTTLSLLRASMAAWLRDRGLEALEAWPREARPVPAAPLVLVRVTGLQADPAGFQRYLGEHYDSAAGQWREWYGHRLTVRYGLDLCSPETLGEAGCRDLLDRVAQALLEGGPAGMALEGWSAEELTFDRQKGMYRLTLRTGGQALLARTGDGEEPVLGFELKGEITL